MDKKILAVAALAILCLGYVAVGGAQVIGDYTRPPAPAVSPGASVPGAPAPLREGDLVFDPLTPDVSGLPDRRDIPFPANLQWNETPRRYTGIIKNKTRYEVSLPSENSGGTLLIPPHSWIEYTMWTRRASVTAYHDGKPFYCLRLIADPKEYPFMCSKYDFIAEIVKPEPVEKSKPMKKRKRLKKQPKC